MSEIGNILESNDSLFEDLFEDTLYVYNYIEGQEGYGGTPEKTGHPDNPIETTGQIEQPTQPNNQSSASGQRTISEAEILVPDDVMITDGGITDSQDRKLSWASMVQDSGGRQYKVVDVFDEGNGRLRCKAVDSEQGEDDE